MTRYRPRVLAVLGITAWRVAFERPRAVLGEQPERIGGAIDVGGAEPERAQRALPAAGPRRLLPPAPAGQPMTTFQGRTVQPVTSPLVT